MSTSAEPPLVTAADFLDEIEGYLETRGKPLEWRGRFDVMAYLAYYIGVVPEQYEEFETVLRNAANDERCRLDIFFNQYSGSLSYVGIKSTHAPQGWAKKGSPDSVEMQREQDALAKYYLAQFEIAQLRVQLEKAKEETGEARAELSEQRRRAEKAASELQTAKLELQRLHHVKVTADDVTRLTAELTAANRAKAKQAKQIAELLQQVRSVGEGYEQYRKNREDHICEVQGLRLLKTTTCKCQVLVDHRQCTGFLHLDIELETDPADVAKKRRQEWIDFEATELQNWKEHEPSYEEVIAVLKRIAGGFVEKLHLQFRAVPVERRMILERLPLMIHRGTRGIRRGFDQFMDDPTAGQRRLSTYTVRKLGDM